MDSHTTTRKPSDREVSSESLGASVKDLKLDASKLENEPPAEEFGAFDDDLVEDAVTLTLDPTLTLDESESTATDAVEPTRGKNKLKGAFEDARHFAGGLIPHPAETTKKYSVLRHSSGLVYYQGPSTSVAVTVFSAQPLPPDRTIWLQKKGWLGKTALRAQAIVRANGSWLDVTPERRVEPEQVDASDERAWQRDIKKFLKKAAKHKHAKHQVARETNAIRIPCEAGDGYFRIVLCVKEGKKVLCPSPVFRVASLSTDSSNIKGASLGTLPIEIGVKVGSTVAATYAKTVAAPYAAVVQSRVTTRVGKYMPGAATQQAAKQAGTRLYDVSGMDDKIKSGNVQFDKARGGRYETIPDGKALPPLPVIGSDLGPEPPYPLPLQSKIVKGTGKSKELGVPTANLKSIPEDIRYRLAGYYFGWASVPRPKSDSDAKAKLGEIWYPALILAAPCPHAIASSAPEKLVKVHIIDFQGVDLEGTKISLIIMGFLHQCPPAGNLLSADDLLKDVEMIMASLDRPAWVADEALQQIKSSSSNKSLTDRYVDARRFGQNQVDRVPVHRAGIRTQTVLLRDKTFGHGGFCIPR